jgi:hypothetical protein
MKLTLHNQAEASDEDNNAQLFEPGEEPLLEGQVMSTRKKRKYMSWIEYFAYHSHPHHNKTHHIFKAGCLFQEYMVDSWDAAEQSHLTWLRNNQKILCSDVYKGLVDAVAADPDVEAHNLRQRTILPSTVTTRLVVIGI